MLGRDVLTAAVRVRVRVHVLGAQSAHAQQQTPSPPQLEGAGGELQPEDPTRVDPGAQRPPARRVDGDPVEL